MISCTIFFSGDVSIHGSGFGSLNVHDFFASGHVHAFFLVQVCLLDIFLEITHPPSG